ncbi:MAG: ATP-binding cassette domain-containing protein [Negativicutes bacterium]|jgi:sulfonate transport system ATP-binding protein|nr:ATP-binding cassette domain-containing protein [Negativicutes bacterium]
MTEIKFHLLSKNYSHNQKTLTALTDIHFSIETHAFTVLLGPEKAGKTTLLRILAGLEKPTVGKIQFPLDHNEKPQSVGMVFSEPRLMPWLTVKENLLFGLKETPSEKEIDQLLKLLNLIPYKDSYPRQINLETAQNVALGRTLVHNPDIIVMDDPFRQLSYLGRIKLQEEWIRLPLLHKKTIIFATQDIEEAAFLAQRIVIMDNGEVSSDYPIPKEHQHQRHGQALNIIKKNLLAILQRFQSKP